MFEGTGVVFDRFIATYSGSFLATKTLTTRGPRFMKRCRKHFVCSKLYSLSVHECDAMPSTLLTEDQRYSPKNDAVHDCLHDKISCRPQLRDRDKYTSFVAPHQFHSQNSFSISNSDTMTSTICIFIGLLATTWACHLIPFFYAKHIAKPPKTTMRLETLREVERQGLPIPHWIVG